MNTVKQTKSSDFIEFFLAIIYLPFYYLFLITKFIKGEIPNILIFTFSIALLLTYGPIMFDVSSNFHIAILSEFENPYENYTFYNQIIIFLMNSLGLQFNSIMLIFYWFCLYSTFMLFLKNSNNPIFILFILILISLVFRNIVDLNRNYTAFILAIYSIIFFRNNKLIFSFAAFVLALSIHISCVVFFILYLISRIKALQSLRWMTYLIYGFLFTLGYFFLDFLQFGFFGNEGTRISMYFSDSSTFGRNVVGRLLYLRVYDVLFFIILTYLILKNFNKLNEKQTAILFISFVAVCVALFFYRTLFERMHIMAILVLFLFLSRNINFINERFVKGLVFSYFLSRFILINVFLYSHVFSEEYNHIFKDHDLKMEFLIKPLYVPTILLLDYQSNGYSDEVLMTNLERGKEDFWVID
tara:strand:- start:13926 stop:15164 length:1239 start_codon:yes stop_codon:yes gene_type:complete